MSEIGQVVPIADGRGTPLGGPCWIVRRGIAEQDVVARAGGTERHLPPKRTGARAWRKSEQVGEVVGDVESVTAAERYGGEEFALRGQRLPGKRARIVKREERTGLARSVNRSGGRDSGCGDHRAGRERRLPNQLAFWRKSINAVGGGEVNVAVGRKRDAGNEVGAGVVGPQDARAGGIAGRIRFAASEEAANTEEE